MKMIKPIIIDDSNFVTSNVVESEVAWNSSDTYAIGDERRVGHVVYKAAAANTNKDPSNAANRAIWPILGVTNRWKMFDMTRGVEIQTVNSDYIEVEVTLAKLYSAVALFGVSASTIRIEIIDGSNGVVYDETTSLSTNTGIDYYFAWFYTAPTFNSQLVVLDIPYYPNATLRVTAANMGNEVKVGKLVVGYAKAFGCTSYGTNVRFLDFSRRDRDEFGNLVTVERRKVSERTFQVKVDSDRLAQVEATIKGLGTTPTVFVGSPTHQVTIIFGLAIDFNSDYAFKKTNYSLKVQEF